MNLLRRIGPDFYEVIGDELIQTWSRSVAWVIGTTPFAALAFLWFTGVMRDHLGMCAGKFLATVFFGSSIIFVLAAPLALRPSLRTADLAAVLHLGGPTSQGDHYGKPS